MLNIENRYNYFKKCHLPSHFLNKRMPLKEHIFEAANKWKFLSCLKRFIK